MTANVITYRGKSAAREVGKALDLDEVQIDRLAKVMHQFEYIDPDDTLARRLAEVGMAGDAPRVRHFASCGGRCRTCRAISASTRAAWWCARAISSSVVPLENASMPGVVVQWDKEDCADMGIIKVDLLGLGMMAVLQDTIHLINSDEPGAETSIRSGVAAPPTIPTCIGCCVRRIRSACSRSNRARRWRRCRACSPTTSTISSSRWRSSARPIVGNMVHPYLNRRAGREAVVYDHPLLEPILKRTLGVPLFQEQLLRMAMAVGGFTGGQAEDLRRAMGFKRSEKRMKQLEGLLREGMAKNGITGETADRIVLAITSFALYGFPESHAASFALLAYASAYLKAHYPAAFYTALLNNQPMGFYHPATLVKDAQRRGVRFGSIDVQVSDWGIARSSPTARFASACAMYEACAKKEDRPLPRQKVRGKRQKQLCVVQSVVVTMHR